jgi:hypothetical protein
LSSTQSEPSGSDITSQLWLEGYVAGPLPDQFYDVGTELPAVLGLTSHGASRHLPSLSELSARLSQLPSPDYLEVVYVDIGRDKVHWLA